MADRKAELELKKAQLNALREEKRKKDEQRKSGNHVNGTDQKANNLRDQTEEMLKELGIEPVVEEEKPSEGSEKPLQNGFGKLRNLEVMTVNEIDISPHEPVNYCKETQTINELSSLSVREKDLSTDYYVPTFEDDWDEDEILSSLTKHKSTKTSKARNMHNSIHNGPGLEEFENLREVPKIPTLTDSELNQRLLTDGFLRFFSRSTQMMERALCLQEEQQMKSMSPPGGGGSAVRAPTESMLTLNRQFYDEKWSKQRVVSAIDWSTTYPELLLVGYQANESAPTQPDGVCLLWNMLYPRKSSPEYTFHCPSSITSACLSRFHPNLVIAGTHSGMIVLWDTRSYKKVPVHKTQISQKAHGHPVSMVQVVGTQNAHNIVSLSSDGALRAWSIENFTQPVEATRVLEGSLSGGVHEISPTCMSFFANDVNNFALGADNNCAYTEQRHSSRSGGVRHDGNRLVAYEGHTSPITSISCHPCPGEINFSSLFLTTSLDWTTRLWTVRERRPLYTFGECFECVYDAQWSPIHPALFATADGNGRINMWDLNRDFETPVVKKRIGIHGDDDAFEAGVMQQVSITPSSGGLPTGMATGAGGSTSASVGPAGNSVALSKLRWDHTGLFLAAGDVAGRVHVYSVAKELAKPQPDAGIKFAKQMQEMRNTKIEVQAAGAPPNPSISAGSMLLGNAGLGGN